MLATATANLPARARSVARQNLLLGVNLDTRSSNPADVAAAAALHAGVVRIEVPWSAFEPEAGKVAEDRLAELSRLLAQLRQDHLKAIIFIDRTPCWASSAPPEIEDSCVPRVRSKANAWPPREPATFGRFAAFFARHYGSELAAIEIWNEPDQANEDYLAGPEKAKHYAELLKAGYLAIKQVAPSLPVLGGSFVGPNGRFLELLYANHIEGYYNGLAVHFYTLTIAALQTIHRIQLRYGDHTPIWLDEFGWSSCWPKERIQEEQGCVTAQVQAENLANLIHELVRLPYVQADVFYKLQDSPGENFGVLTESGAKKPAFQAVEQAFTHPFQKPAPIRLQAATKDKALVVQGSAPVGDYLVLEALRRGHLRYRAYFTLNRFNRFQVTVPPRVGNRGLLVRVYRYGYRPASGARLRA